MICFIPNSIMSLLSYDSRNLQSCALYRHFLFNSYKPHQRGIFADYHHPNPFRHDIAVIINTISNSNKGNPIGALSKTNNARTWLRMIPWWFAQSSSSSSCKTATFDFSLGIYGFSLSRLSYNDTKQAVILLTTGIESPSRRTALSFLSFGTVVVFSMHLS